MAKKNKNISLIKINFKKHKIILLVLEIFENILLFFLKKNDILI